jgi:hypothetical protein
MPAGKPDGRRIKVFSEPENAPSSILLRFAGEDATSRSG